jgi:acyl carrier protein
MSLEMNRGTIIVYRDEDVGDLPIMAHSEARVSLAREFDAQPGLKVEKKSIGSKVRTYIVDNFLLGAQDGLDDNTELMENGILDSTGAMELVAFLESTFAITIEEEEIVPENLNTVAEICNFVWQKSS